MSAPADRGGAGWHAAPERSNRGLLQAMSWLAVTAGRPAARWLLHPITLYFVVAHAPARRASRRYLGRALGRPARFRDLYRHVHAFASTVLDRVYFLRGHFERFEISAKGAAELHALLDQGEGVLLVGAHIGSFEALRAVAQERGARVAMLMYEDNARLINATLAAIAPQAQLNTIALGRPGAMLALRRWLDGGGLAGLLADRTLPGHSDRSRPLQLDFLGAPAPFSDGPFRLGALLRRRIVFMAGLYHGGNRYELRFVELADFRAGAPGDAEVRAALVRYATLLESLCRELPYNWFNFYDFWADDADVPAPAAARADAPDGARP